MQVKVVKVDGKKVLETFDGKYQRLLAAEASRIVRRNRARVQKKIVATARQKRMFNPLFLKKGSGGIEKFIWQNPKRDAVSPGDIVSGFTRSVEASNLRPNLWAARKNYSTQVMTRRGVRYLISVDVGGKRVSEPGVFWGVWAGKKLQRVNKLGTGRKGVAFIRPEFNNPNKIRGKYNLDIIKGPSVATMLRKFNVADTIINEGEARFTKDLIAGLERISAKLNAGIV